MKIRMDIRNPTANALAPENDRPQFQTKEICAVFVTLVLIHWVLVGIFLYGCMKYCGTALRVQLIAVREISTLQEWISSVC